VLGHRVLQLRLDDPEAAGQRQAQPAGDAGQLGLGFPAVVELERRVLGQALQDRLQLDVLVDLAEGVDAFLQSLGDRQVARPDDDVVVRLGVRLAALQQIVDLPVEEIVVALEVGVIHIQARRGAEEALELGNVHHGHEGLLLCLRR
jgi:hypothetical protein